MTSIHISRVMPRHNIQSVGILLKKISNFIHPASVITSTSSRLAIPIRLASRRILSSGEVRLGLIHHQPVAASQTQNIKGSINMDQIIRVVTEINSLPKKIKGEAGLCLNRLWKPQ
jgi:hypothetical protein